MRRIFYATIAALSITAACNKTNNDYCADHGIPACEYTSKLDSLFTPMFPDNEPGAIVTVMRNDTIIYNHAFGLASLETSHPITDSTLFNMASASKIFCAAALLRLSEQGAISLDDPLSKYFPNSILNFSTAFRFATSLPTRRACPIFDLKIQANGTTI